MNIYNKTVLITGGGSGIGLAIAKSLTAKGNTVIITARTEDKLKNAVAQINGLQYVVADINNQEDVLRIKDYLQTNFSGLDVLINNAGHAHYYKLHESSDFAAKATEEMQTNYLSIIHLNEQLLSLLKKDSDTVIVNVSSVVAFTPSSVIPTYSASKAALHSYTQSLRYALSKTSNIKVFELMPPLVNTEFSSAIGGENGIPPSEVAESLISGLENDIYEIHTGNTALIYDLSRKAPKDAFQAMNQERGN